MKKITINLTDNEAKKLEIMRDYISSYENQSDEDVIRRALSVTFELLNAAANPIDFSKLPYGGAPNAQVSSFEMVEDIMSFDLEDDDPDDGVCPIKGKKLI